GLGPRAGGFDESWLTGTLPLCVRAGASSETGGAAGAGAGEVAFTSGSAALAVSSFCGWLQATTTRGRAAAGRRTDINVRQVAQLRPGCHRSRVTGHRATAAAARAPRAGSPRAP